MKRLVCCMDGTWNDDRSPADFTNIVRLHRAVRDVGADNVPQQSYYVKGIAVDDAGKSDFWQGVIGADTDNRVREGFRCLRTYEPGDEIYLYGFSRGAYEARALASFVSLFGVGTPSFDFPAAWALFQTSRHKPDPIKLADLRRNAIFPVRIRCVGVWDTVGNIGDPLIPDGLRTRRLKRHDHRLPEAVDVGLHALSIDEIRQHFRPTLFTIRKGTTLPEGQHIEQVWFPGYHADVGGGYCFVREDGQRFAETELSDISLSWMAERTMALTGLAFDLDKLHGASAANPLGRGHTERGNLTYPLSTLIPYRRLIDQNRRSIWVGRRLLMGSFRTARIPPGEVSVNETIHPSAKARFGHTVPVRKSGASNPRILERIYGPLNLALALKRREVESQ